MSGVQMRVFGNRAILLVVNREAGQVDDVESRGAFEVRRERDQALVVLGSAPLTKPLNGKRKGFRKSRFSKIKKEKGMEIEFFFKNRKRKKGKGFFLPKSKKEKRKGFFLKTRKGKEKCGLELFPTKHK
jgi:hypothetical protein